MDNTLVLESFFDQASEAMLVTNIKGKILKCNPSAQVLLDAIDAPENYLYALTTGAERSDFEHVLAELSEDNPSRKFTSRLNDKSKRTIWVHWYAKYDTKSKYVYWTGRDVTEYKRKEAFLEILEEVTGTGVWELEADGKTVHWSKKIHDIHGTDKDTYEPAIEDALSFYPEESIPILTNALKQQENTGEAYDLTLPFLTAQKKEITVNARGFVQRKENEIVRRYGTFKDVTEEIEEHVEQQKLTNRMVLALKCANIGVWEFDLINQELIWDQRMFDIYGVERRDFKATFKDWESALLPEDVIRAKAEFVRSMETGEQFVSEFRINTPQGEVRHIKAMAANVYNVDGQLSHSIGVNLDFTDDIIQRQQLQTAKERSEAADKAKSRFLATMSHEIRTPLNGIIGGLQILGKLTLPEREKHIAKQSQQSAHSLLRIINDILDYTKIIEDKLDIEYVSVDTKELLEQIIEEHKLLLNDKSIVLRFDYDSDMPTQFMADPTRFRQIITNLLSNAIKFTFNGHVLIDVTLDASKPNKPMRITIKDTGIGMTKKQQDKLFEPFMQADSSITRKFGGTGLGMSIVGKLTELMKGTIEVSSQPELGTTFVLHLPFEPAGVAGKKKPKVIKAPDLSGKRIAVAEDNELNQILIQAMLEETHASVTMAENGQALLEILAKDQYDLIFCDINMPVMGGIEACQKIRLKDKDTPIFAFTANVMEDDVKHYYSVGFDDIIPKPVIREDLYRQLAKRCEPQE